MADVIMTDINFRIFLGRFNGNTYLCSTIVLIKGRNKNEYCNIDKPAGISLWYTYHRQYALGG